MGYGPDQDEWYWEKDLIQTAPEDVKNFNRQWDKNPELMMALVNDTKEE